MQPTLILRAPYPGILYINGRFAGELGPEETLVRPVCPRGAVYLDYRPLNSTCHALARKLVFSGGEPMPRSAEDAEGIDIVLWPGGAVELEFDPEPRHGAPVRFQVAGKSFTLSGEDFACDGHDFATLPKGAEAPTYRALPGGVTFTGRCEGGRYLLTADPELRGQTGFLRAHRIEIESDGRIRALILRNDFAGHATQEIWRLTPEGLTIEASEPTWAEGVPHAPKTAEETARAAVDAALAGFDDEADSYLAPSLRARRPLDEIRARCDLCVEMKYVPPDARPCVGLLSLECDNLARVRPLYYRAAPTDDSQVAYRIEEFTFV